MTTPSSRMDISPKELREIEIKEVKWNGYNRDDVDELLERAAATVERLTAENQQLRARLSQLAGNPSKPSATSAPPAVAPKVDKNFDTSAIQRTLILAQQVADEAVSDAREQAQKIVGDAQVHAEQLVAGAESRAAEIAENERKKLEDEINSLQSARATLSVDVDALEVFEREYRDRLRNALEAELDSFSRMLAGGGARPVVQEISVPPAKSSASNWTETGTSTASSSAAPSTNWDPAPAGGWTSEEAPASSEESLDDDAFFASLRDAVKDDAPLDPNSAQDDDTGEQRKLFRRRK